MRTANVQSLSPKIDELIALIQVENFDVIALNKTWQTPKQASSCRSRHPWLQGFWCGPVFLKLSWPAARFSAKKILSAQYKQRFKDSQYKQKKYNNE